ncbi:DUF6427 family protein [Polaribacter aestuariivivens]|uniref:DUF6427 family protein n=1 Tax=Polaribacter aestuariivivens TaxID=2304626 RepID=UPI003F49526E
MLANFLSKSKPINFIVLLVLFSCVFLYNLIFVFAFEDFSLNVFLKSVGFLLVFLLIFFFYNFVISKNNLTRDNTYAFFIFTLFLSLFITKIYAFKIIFLLLFYVLFLRKIYSLKSNKTVLQKLFDSGFWIAIMFFIEPFTIVFALLVYVAIFIHHKITIHTLFAPIIGFCAPLICYYAYFLWMDNTENFSNLFQLNSINEVYFYSENNFYWIIIVLLALTLIGLILKTPKALSVNNSFKRNWILVLINFFVAVGFSLFIPEKTGVEFLFVIFPASIIIANGFEMINNSLIKNIALYLLLIFTIVFPIFYSLEP